GRQNDAERDADDQVATREGLAARQGQRNRQRRDQRHATANARPAAEKQRLPGRKRITLLSPPKHARQIGVDEDPGESHGNHRHEDKNNIQENSAERKMRAALENLPKLQTGQDKEQTVEEKREHLPDGARL